VDAYSLIYVTCKDETEARGIAHFLISSKQVACANILPPMSTIYEWEGSVHEGNEAAMILKTRQELVESVTESIRSLHSYSCPCIVALPIAQGYPPFLDWISRQTIALA